MEERNEAISRDEQKEERNRRLLERKLRIARNPDGIIFMPFGKSYGRELTRKIIEIDKMMNRIRLQAGFRLDIDKVKETINMVDQVSQQIWEDVKTFVPSLYNTDIKKWRDLNDSKEEKETLAHRRVSIAFEPKCEEVARLRMALKVFQTKGTETQMKADFDELSEINKPKKKVVVEEPNNKKILKRKKLEKKPKEKEPIDTEIVKEEK